MLCRLSQKIHSLARQIDQIKPIYKKGSKNSMYAEIVTFTKKIEIRCKD